ncbi:MAG: hypothetical protein O6952_00835, partial [Planctomycetota bacterium]|nr:hypothetical protein [Planctomycetota bacterium]
MDTRAAGIVVMVCLGLGFPAAGAEADECSVCHEKESVAEDSGVHGPSGISCVDCHGGDPEASEAASAHSTERGFRGAIGRLGVPILCGDCHARTEKMHKAGLR